MDMEEIRNIVAWVMCSMMAVLIAWAPVKCSSDSNEKIAQAIEGGANPIDAACAYATNPGTACVVRAAVSK